MDRDGHPYLFIAAHGDEVSVFVLVLNSELFWWLLSFILPIAVAVVVAVVVRGGKEEGFGFVPQVQIDGLSYFIADRDVVSSVDRAMGCFDFNLFHWYQC